MGGRSGLELIEAYPYALPNLFSALLLFLGSLLAIFFLRDTGRSTIRPRFCPPLLSILGGFFSKKRPTSCSTLKVGQNQSVLEDIQLPEILRPTRTTKHEAKYSLPIRDIFTPNLVMVILSTAIFDFHMGAFNSLIILLFSTERSSQDLANGSQHKSISLFKFTGGLQFDVSLTGYAMAIVGVFGLFLQISLYPWASERLGLIRCFRGALMIFPLAYVLAPYISLLPSWNPVPQPASGPWVWCGVSFILALQVFARTFALPALIILLNNSCPHPSVLATIHGLGQSVSASFRTLGPITAGKLYSVGLDNGVIGLPWWSVAASSAVGYALSFWVYDEING